ncbi:MAG TPA: squalene synthase HpnC [Acidimicrobiales bacterium]|jgi:squalene synthase HpnC|nr:squalene synthase HpnC [Acidimicrobiales bacterium]
MAVVDTQWHGNPSPSLPPLRQVPADVRSVLTAGPPPGRERAENFRVASRLLPKAVRRDLLAVYRFARFVDDLGDEGDATTVERLGWLEWADVELARSRVGLASHPVFADLGATIRDRHLALEPFRRLIEANRVDQTVVDYETFGHLREYCRLSAEPVGEIVLGLFGLATEERLAWSASVCTGLQVVEHCQDVAEDHQRGRTYLPRDDREHFGVRDADLVGPRAGAGLRSLVALEVGRAKALLGAGAALAAQLPGRFRVAVAGFTAGGLAACDAIEAVDFDVLGHRCRPSRTVVAARTMEVLRRPAALWPGASVSGAKQ